jgi:type I restriction enzyme, S subunit
MNDEWKGVPFGELYAEPSRNGLTVPKAERGTGSPMVNMRELFAHDFVSDQAIELVPVPPESLMKWCLSDGDLLFGRRSLTLEGAGKCSIVVKPSQPTVFESSLIRVRLDPSRACPRYFYYFFKSPPGRHLIETIVEQVAVAGIRSSDLARLVVPLPPLIEQRRIALVLSAMDDLIAQNRRLVRSCITVAETAFKRLVATATASLPFSHTVEIMSGGTPRTAEPAYWGGPIPWLSVADTPAEGEAWVLRTAKHITELGLNNSPAQVLDPGTTIVTARGTVGNVALVGVPMAINQSCYGLRSRVGIRGYYTFFATVASVEALRQRAHGSVFDTITRASFDAVECPLPQRSEIEDFESVVDPLMVQARELLWESDTLRASRDELLPLLLTGRVRVGDVAA